ncbi:MAG: ABC transporter substrate-binding protein [Candidatus Limiplasma sp.]|nr:ABC transporter substrate-binding protein [Candidatus Limiplasma sp.]
MKRMRLLTSTLVATMLAVILLAGSIAGAYAEPVTIRFWGGWTGPDADTMKGLTEQFMAENPDITVEFESQQWTPLFTQVFAEADSGGAPDVLAMHPLDMGQFVEMGLLDDTMAASLGLQKEDYSETAWNGTLYNGVQYGVPLDLHMHGLYYNKDKFEAAGIEAPPATGAELIETAQRLTLDANGKNAAEEGFDKDNIVQYGLGFHQHHHIIFQLTGLLAQQGETAFTADMTELAFNQELAAKALAWIQDFAYRYNTTPIGEASPPDDFKAGNIAMLIDGPWQMPSFKAAGVNFGTAPYPQVFDQPAAWGSGHLFTFPLNNSGEAEKEAIKTFMAWMSQNSGKWAESGNIPASATGREYASTLENRQAFIDSMPTMRLFPAHPKAAEIFSNAQGSPFINAAQSLMLEGTDPAQVVKTFVEEMNAELSAP